MENELTLAEAAEKVINGELISIYHMRLHECFQKGNQSITRVPGGWIYANAMTLSGVFVPFNTEFRDTQYNVLESDRAT